MAGTRGPYGVDWEEIAWDFGFKGNDKEMLTQWHHTDRLSQEDIGRKLNVSGATVGKRMRLLGVEARRVPSNLPSYSPRLPKKGT